LKIYIQFVWMKLSFMLNLLETRGWNFVTLLLFNLILKHLIKIDELLIIFKRIKDWTLCYKTVISKEAKSQYYFQWPYISNSNRIISIKRTLIWRLLTIEFLSIRIKIGNVSHFIEHSVANRHGTMNRSVIITCKNQIFNCQNDSDFFP